MSTMWKLVAVALVVVTLGVGLAACGEEETSDEARQQLMTDLDAFKASFAGLTELSPTSTVDDVQAVKEDVQASWDQVKVSAADVKEAEVGQVESAWDDLAQAVDDLDSDTPLNEIVPSLSDEVQALRAARTSRSLAPRVPSRPCGCRNAARGGRIAPWRSRSSSPSSPASCWPSRS